MSEVRSRNRLLAVLFVGVLMGALDIAIVGPALKPIGNYFGVDARGLQWVFTIYVLFNVIGTPLMAKLSDLYGRRPIYVLDVALFGIGSITAGLAPSFEVLLFARALQGFGAGGIFPVASAVIGDTFPPERRGSALGLIGAVWGLAFIVGPLVGLALLGFGWEWIFFVNIPVAIGVIIAAARILPSARRAGPVRFDWAGVGVLGVMLAALALGISQIDSEHLGQSLTSLSVLPFLLLAVVLMPVFWWIEQRAAEPVVRPDLLKKRQLVLANLLGLGTGLGEASLVFVPALAVVLLGVSAQISSALLFPIVLTMAVGTPLVGRLLDRLGSKVVVIAGGVLLAAGMLLMSVITANLWLFVGVGVLIGAGLSSLLGAPMRYIVLNEAGAQDRGAAQAVLAVFTSVGQLLGAALVGAVAASRGGGAAGYTAAYGAIGLVAVAITIGAFLLKSRAQERATAQVSTAEFGQSRRRHPSNADSR
ncbi:MAG: MFS transporter [Chloroflexota bacterium]